MHSIFIFVENSKKWRIDFHSIIVFGNNMKHWTSGRMLWRTGDITSSSQECQNRPICANSNFIQIRLTWKCHSILLENLVNPQILHEDDLSIIFSIYNARHNIKSDKRRLEIIQLWKCTRNEFDVYVNSKFIVRQAANRWKGVEKI